MKVRTACLATAALMIVMTGVVPSVWAQKKHQNAIIDLWTQNKPAFGVYVPSMGQPLWNEPMPDQPPAGQRGERGQSRPDPVYTREIGQALAKDPLVDFAFLNLE